MSHALAVTGLRGVVTVDPDGTQILGVRLTAGFLRISDAGLRGLIPPGVPLMGDRIEEGRVHFRVIYRGVEGAVQARPEVSPAGRLRLEIISARALIFPIPASMITFLFSSMAPDKPGIHAGEGGHPEIDLGEILAPAGITLPPLRHVHSGRGELVLTFSE